MPDPRHASLRGAPFADDAIVSEDHMIPSDTPGIRLFVRGKRAAGLATYAPERTILLVHGSSYPAASAFDLPHAGLSWLDHLARHGYDAYCLDVRGYGRSTRPPEMDHPASQSSPVVRTETAIRDVGAAVAFILARRGIPRLSLLGWSWGTTLMGAYAAANGERVHKLVLLAPQWLRTTPSASDQGGALGAYRLITREAARERWLRGVPEPLRAATLPDDWFEAWADATFATDPWGAAQAVPVVRAPNGTVQDSREYWAAGRPFYDPGDIRAPVLAVHGEWDAEFSTDMVQAYVRRLTGAPYWRWVEIGAGTHTFILETGRWQALDAVQAFLDED
ncbi:alpha/beta hydrolase [Salinarimonas soli]|uniref:Alpha/beta hydrolase n=1 Tax=Salinarimonas soli TaxID=1638099 RepID=A0A5B2VC64_9HYPH|nr:alpha/beta fold hydrolase [Salinarimonas soli]KAA2236584.1 alpha/beta hydrolase [Salinarimonas soli]